MTTTTAKNLICSKCNIITDILGRRKVATIARDHIVAHHSKPIAEALLEWDSDETGFETSFLEIAEQYAALHMHVRVIQSLE